MNCEYNKNRFTERLSFQYLVVSTLLLGWGLMGCSSTETQTEAVHSSPEKIQPDPIPSTQAIVEPISIKEEPSKTPPAEKSIVLDKDGIPVDGIYTLVEVEGVRVPRIQIREKGRVVRVNFDGFSHDRWHKEYTRSGPIPRGSFNGCKTDTNNDGDFSDELTSESGLWKIDGEGNLLKVQ